MYAKCGALAKAHQLLNELPVRDAICWNAILAGYAQNGQGKEALESYKQMSIEGLSPDAITYIWILKACGIVGDVDRGKQLHEEIVSQRLLDKDLVLGNALINMYAKCGALTTAQQVLEELLVRDVVSWSGLITGYAQQGLVEGAMDCLQRMRIEGLSPNTITYACILKACSIAQEVGRGKQIHDQIVDQGFLAQNITLGNALVDMYIKCDALLEAQQLLGDLAVRDVVLWNALIARYAEHGQLEEALDSFQSLKKKGLSPDAITYTCILKACGNMRDLNNGKKIHDEIINCGLWVKDIKVGTALIDMYAKCGMLTQAQEVIEKLPVRNLVSWSALIAGYTQMGQGERALSCYQCMESEGFSPNAITYTCILKACGITGKLDRGKRIHDEILSQGILGEDVVLGNALVDMYAKCGDLTRAREVLEELSVRDVVSWSSLIAAYVQQGQVEKALDGFEQMQSDGLSPDAITYLSILQACGMSKAIDMGKQVHDIISRQDLLEKHIALGNALIDMYGKCGAVMKAQQVLDELPFRDVVSWSSLIAGYAEQGRFKEALNSYTRMQSDGLCPNAITYTSILKVCGTIGELDTGKQIHDEIIDQGLLGHNMVLGNALVDMYVKCGAISKAQQVLYKLPVRDVVSWNAIIAGYAQKGQIQEAEKFFKRMGKESISSDIVSWNAMIGGYAQGGQAIKAIDCFERMQREGVTPNAITFLCLLNACSHTGLVDEGQILFENMIQKYGMTPDMEHHTCMVDLFGRSGHFDKAMAVIKSLPHSDYLPLWFALLGACQKWRNVRIGKVAFEHAVQVDKCYDAVYLCMVNIYIAAGMQEDARKVEAMRVRKGYMKADGTQHGGSMYIAAGMQEDARKVEAMRVRKGYIKADGTQHGGSL